MWTRFPATEAGRFSLQATFLLSSRTSRWQRQDPWIALVAQGIERLPPEQKVVGSNPIEGTEETPAAWKSSGGFCVLPPGENPLCPEPSHAALTPGAGRRDKSRRRNALAAAGFQDLFVRPPVGILACLEPAGSAGDHEGPVRVRVFGQRTPRRYVVRKQFTVGQFVVGQVRRRAVQCRTVSSSDS